MISWQDRDYITIYSKKNENNNTIYLECNKREKAKNKCPGRAKYDKKSSMIYIYAKIA